MKRRRKMRRLMEMEIMKMRMDRLKVQVLLKSIEP
jgi:hypothetical protein